MPLAEAGTQVPKSGLPPCLTGGRAGQPRAPRPAPRPPLGSGRVSAETGGAQPAKPGARAESAGAPPGSPRVRPGKARVPPEKAGAWTESVHPPVPAGRKEAAVDHAQYSRAATEDVVRLRRRIVLAGLPPRRTDANVIVGTWNV